MRKVTSTEKSIRFRPVYRRASLVQISPTPTKKDALNYLKYFSNNWQGLKEEYIKIVSETSKISLDNLHFDLNEEAVTRVEKNTFVLDFPRLYSNNKSKFFFDARLCAAICTGTKSTKIWARVGIPYYENKEETNKITIGEMKSTSPKLNEITVASCDWLYKKLKLHLSSQNKINKIRHTGFLNVVALGIKDHKLEPMFDLLRNPPVKLDELIKFPNAERILMKYFNIIAGTNGSISNISKNFPESFWFSSPVSIDVADHYIESAPLLYLIRAIEDTTQVTGIGYDNSIYGDLSQKSSLKVARWIAQRI